jgi:hypothetical protein
MCFAPKRVGTLGGRVHHTYVGHRIFSRSCGIVSFFFNLYSLESQISDGLDINIAFET